MFRAKKESDISSQKKIKLFNESNAHSRKWLARVVTVMAVSIILFTTGGIANAATGGKLVQWINGLFLALRNLQLLTKLRHHI